MIMPEVEAQTLAYESKSDPPELKLPAWAQYAILLVILLANVLLKAPNLGHASLKPMDESFHAVVARNLLYDPFKPTLIREPYLPYDPTDWLNNHVWLHKPVLPLWIIALAFKIMGVSALALRIPSLTLCTGAIVWTFLIARKLYGPVPALIASAIQAIVPTIGMIVHGYVFSDAIDINLLFWSELSLLLMLYAPSRKWVVGSGCAAGAAFMSKTFPALFTFAPLMTIAMLNSLSQYPGRGQGRGARRAQAEMLPESQEPSPCVQGEGVKAIARMLLWWFVAFIMIAAPWNIYCAIRFPTEFKSEFGLILSHVSENVENWASPWDRLWFQHLPSALYHFWTISLVGSIVLTIRAIQLKKWEWLFVPVWIASVLIPFTLAASKTPSATLIAWPALMIGAGFLISRACQGYLLEFATTLALLIAMTFFRGTLITKGWGPTQPFEILIEARWIAWHLAIGLAVMGLSLAWDKRLRGKEILITSMIVAIGVGWLCVGTTKTAWKVQTLNRNQRAFQDTGVWIDQHLPRNAVICTMQDMLFKSPAEKNRLAFYANRTVIEAQGRVGEEEIRKRGGSLYFLTEAGSVDVTMPLYTSKLDGCSICTFP